MSYESRRRKRENRAKEQAQRRNRRQHPDRWYLTPTKKVTSCDRCGNEIKKDDPMVYRNKPRTKLHRLCAEQEKIAPLPSFRWEKLERKKRGKPKPGAPMTRGTSEDEFAKNLLAHIRKHD